MAKIDGNPSTSHEGGQFDVIGAKIWANEQTESSLLLSSHLNSAFRVKQLLMDKQMMYKVTKPLDTINLLPGRQNHAALV